MCIRDRGYIEDNAPVFYPLDFSGLEKYMLEEGDLLMSLTGNVGRVALIQRNMLPAALNQRVACLRLRSNRITKGFLFHILNSDLFEQQCVQASNGVAQKNMSTEWLRDYEIPLYSMEEQLKITEILDKTRRIIDLRNYELSVLDDLIKARFVEMFGDPVCNPLRWEKKTLKEVCIKLNDGTHFSPESFETGEYKYVTAKNIKMSGFDFTNITYVPEEVHRPIYERCNPELGDVLYIKDGVTTVSYTHLDVYKRQEIEHGYQENPDEDSFSVEIPEEYKEYSTFTVIFVDRYGMKYEKKVTDVDEQGRTEVEITEEDYVEQDGDLTRKIDRFFNGD